MRIKEKENGELGKRPENREPEELLERGVINLDKPKGPGSHQVSHWVKKILGVEKAGHGGTLDPNATGVLSIALRKATKVLRLLLKGKKEYIGLAVLHENRIKEKVKEALQSFQGTIIQVPPVKSSVKRRAREREVYEIELLEKQGRNVLFRVECGAGTYVRKLIVSLGEELGIRAHMADLRRTRVGPLKVEEAVTLYDLEDAFYFWKEEGEPKYIKKCILPVEFLLKNIPKIYVFDSAAKTIARGTPVYAPGVSKLSDDIRRGQDVGIMTLKGELIGLGEAQMTTGGILKSEEGEVSTIDSVVYNPNEKQ